MLQLCLVIRRGFVVRSPLMNPLPLVRTKLRLAGAVGLAVLMWIGLDITL
jgi:hypothetical protein